VEVETTQPQEGIRKTEGEVRCSRVKPTS